VGLSRRLFRLSKRDDFTLGRAVRRKFLVFGATGSGKNFGPVAEPLPVVFYARAWAALSWLQSPKKRDCGSNMRRSGKIDDLIIFGPIKLWAI